MIELMRIPVSLFDELKALILDLMFIAIVE